MAGMRPSRKQFCAVRRHDQRMRPPRPAPRATKILGAHYRQTKVNFILTSSFHTARRHTYLYRISNARKPRIRLHKIPGMREVRSSRGFYRQLAGPINLFVS